MLASAKNVTNTETFIILYWAHIKIVQVGRVRVATIFDLIYNSDIDDQRVHFNVPAL